MITKKEISEKKASIAKLEKSLAEAEASYKKHKKLLEEYGDPSHYVDTGSKDLYEALQSFVAFHPTVKAGVIQMIEKEQKELSAMEEQYHGQSIFSRLFGKK